MKRIFKLALFMVIILCLSSCDLGSPDTTTIPVNTANETTDLITTTEDELSRTLRSIYNLSLESSSFDGTYEEWLETVRGPEGLPGEDGRDITMRVNNNLLEWSYQGEDSWTVLLDFSDISGDDGADGQDGEDGRNIELQVDGTVLEWKYTDATQWVELLDFSTLKPEGGSIPEIGDNGNWWIDGADTGISAFGTYTDDDNVTDGLRFQMITYDGEYGYEVVEYEGTDSIVYIPNVINDMPVISIANDVFYDNDIIVEVYIPKSVRKMGSFEGASSLTNVYIPEDSRLVEIEDRTFYGCDWLVEFAVPNNVVTIGDRAFYDCDNLEKVTLGDSVISLGDYAFYSCDKLNYFEFNNVLERIESYCFDNSMGTTAFLIPESVTFIGYNAFDYSSYNIIYCEIDSEPDTWDDNWVSSSYRELIQFGAIFTDDYIYKIESNKATIIGYVGDEENLVIPATLDGYIVNKLGDYAFMSNVNFTTVKIPNTVTEIGTSSIRYSENLRWVYVPSSVKIVQTAAVNYIDDYDDEESILGLRIYIESSVLPTGWSETWNGLVSEVDDFIYKNYYFGISFDDFSTTETLQYIIDGNEVHITGYMEHNNELLIPNEIDNLPVTEISDFAFLGNYYLEEVVFGDNITDIGKYAFYYTCSLKEIEFNEGLVNIGNYAFADLEELLYIRIPESVVIIGEYAFTDCESAIGIYIPKTVYIIGQYAFNDCYDATIYTNASEKPTGWDSTWNQENRPVEWETPMDDFYYGEYYLGIIEGTSFYIVKYVGYENLVIIPEKIDGYNVVGIKSYAFGSGSLPSSAKVVIPDTITEMDYHAFNESSLYIFIERTSAHSNWDENWYYNYNVYIYYEGEWQYNDDMEPVVI